ncbi:amidohydrolase [Microbacterium invictum]|uniref:Amidohydrolase n=1 Tax=Microbacterium invictum TaxID=515415 RepID=A0ABZ0V704_9MICO|nr:amidohydrolase [Microbacterium invictum]WQB69388.1 amidohydrolase [Microbacterium invictum]
MPTDRILTAGTVITMDPARPRADAIALSGERIVAVGTVAECRAVLPDAALVDTGAAALLPGFIDAHSHPVLSGMATMPPAYWIAPWFAPTWDDVLAVFRRAIDETQPGAPLSFFGFDGLLQRHATPDADELDAIFGDRMVLVANNSGHAASVTSAVLRTLGWTENPPADPVGGSFGRRADGRLDGRATEVPAMMALATPVLQAVSTGTKPLQGAVEYYMLMASAGITSTSEHTYKTPLKQAYETLAALPHCPLRITLYHMSTEPDCADPFVSTAPATMLRKRGIKLWADGSPWVGNVAMSTPYLDTPTTRAAGIPAGVTGEGPMNYTRVQLDALLDAHAPTGWQMAFHVNGDIALDVVLDAFSRALDRHGLTRTDHRWRVEHIGGARRDQFRRMADLGVVASMGPFQFHYWGDLLDGQIFEAEVGSRWQRFRDAFDAGVHPSFHNDGSVSPPSPLLNIQTAVTRRTSSGAVRGVDQAVTLFEAIAAETVNAAFALGTEAEVGSIAPGKLADLVALDADPFAVAPERIGAIGVKGTWIGGEAIDLGAFAAASGQVDDADFAALRTLGIPACCHLTA